MDRVRAGIATTIVLILVGIIGTVADPRCRAQLFGEWGYRHFVTVGERVALVNRFAARTQEHGEWLALGASAEYIPYSALHFGVQSIDPPVMTVVRQGSGATPTPLVRTSERTFEYRSTEYGLLLTFTITGSGQTDSGIVVSLAVQAAELR